MITEQNGVFYLQTENTGYAFRVTETGQLEHLYYGRKIRGMEHCFEALSLKQAFAPGNTISYDAAHGNVTLESLPLEFSTLGKGDVGEPVLELVHPDGCRTSDFVYDSYEISQGKEVFQSLPGSYDEKQQVMQLKMILRDAFQKQKLELFYWVYSETDVITRSLRLTSEAEGTVRLERALSMLLDLQGTDYLADTFTGAWAREMHRNMVPVCGGKVVLSSMTGTSSSRMNSFFMLEKPDTSEDAGECLGFHMLYSGNHYEALESSPFGKTRVVMGIQPQGFCWNLNPGESFETPEVVMSFSAKGRNGLSRNLHAFIREHIVRGSWKHRERPILINSWEAFYFQFNEARLLKLAEAAKNVGIELFVLDDGWFGNRDDDTSSLGDWRENLKKLPGGLKGLSEKLGKLGMKFGLWVEPEMVNVKSDLYQQHPEWVLEHPGSPHSEGRNQRMLDLGNPEVQNYIIEEMSRVFSSADIAYVKWDMNRIVSDAFSRTLPAQQQGEVMHRYYLGLYRCMKELTQRFPDILFEGCASGGNRFDLGILCYFPQIWASDNTDSFCRAEIQNGYSYGYPQSVISAHVSSCPNHQTLRVTPLETRFGVAAFGILGYECNLLDMKKEDLEAIRVQTTLYKQWREVLQYGQFYRGRTFGDGGQSSFLKEDGNLQEWYCVSKDRARAVMLLLRKAAIPNAAGIRIRMKGIDSEKTYYFSNRELRYNVKGFGDLVNTVAPVHIRQDSLLHNAVAHFVKMDGEKEEYVLGGDALMYAGVNLKQPYGGTGYSEQVSYLPDFSARMYFLEEIERMEQ